jgi:ABC-type sugar transport system ATPase subunit
MSDRVAVMAQGTIVDVVDRREMTAQRILTSALRANAVASA